MEKEIQTKSDKFISGFLGWIPKTFKPNYLTLARLIMVPFVYYLLQSNQIFWGFVLFSIAALTDLVDGVLARTRNQVSDLGKIFDPIADKLLIASVLLYIGIQYLVIKIFLLIIVFELVANIWGKKFSKSFNIPIGANFYGKIKMVVQCICILVFLIGVLIKNEDVILISQYLLYLALFFALISGLEQLRRSAVNKYKKRKEK